MPFPITQHKYSPIPYMLPFGSVRALLGFSQTLPLRFRRALVGCVQQDGWPRPPADTDLGTERHTPTLQLAGRKQPGLSPLHWDSYAYPINAQFEYLLVIAALEKGKQFILTVPAQTSFWIKQPHGSHPRFTARLQAPLQLPHTGTGRETPARNPAGRGTAWPRPPRSPALSKSPPGPTAAALKEPGLAAPRGGRPYRQAGPRPLAPPFNPFPLTGRRRPPAAQGADKGADRPPAAHHGRAPGLALRASAGNGDGAAAFRCFPFRRADPPPPPQLHSPRRV